MIENLLGLIDYHDQQIASRSLSKKLGLDKAVTLYALDKGESISSEASVSSKLLQVLDGQLEVTVENQVFALNAGSLTSVQQGQIYSLEALEKCKILLIEL